jgi:hypothetical protein
MQHHDTPNAGPVRDKPPPGKAGCGIVASGLLAVVMVVGVVLARW